ncbi:MAG: peptide chain release factor N(5)-glutamine methyltransferase [Synechococcaceae cyanobacterium]|nr:peptide chain release factor N(5)-glutamine methyltransferase [Synechococcaceae cyanobacterium]
MAFSPTGSAVPSAPVPGQGEELLAEELLGWRRRQLADGGSSAEFDWLLDLAGGLGWSELQRLRLEPRRSVALRLGRPGLEALWQRHLRTAEPLQYLVGVCPWRDLELAVAPGVLIPRQETEILVELALRSVPATAPPALWADLGTGSGCLAIALARALPASAGLAVDLSAEALAQATANLARHGLAERVAILRGSWWQALHPWWGRLGLVVSNPPYIPSLVLAGLDPVVRQHEPALALDGGADGLAAIRAIVADAPRALAPGGRLLIEHHHDQSPAVVALLHQAGLVDVRADRDLEGVSRFASACRPEAPR